MKTIKTVCKGETYGLSKIKGQAPRLLQPVIHFMGCRLGGIALTNQTLDHLKKAGKPIIEIQTGFEYLRAHGPMGSDQNQNVEWTEMERNSPESPLFGWQSGLIKESLANLTWIT